MKDYETWAARYPQAARDLGAMIGALPWPATEETEGKSEAWAQQQARFQIAKQGAQSYRNNNGATPAKCPDCGAKQRMVRYGLANDSTKLNEIFKSSDLILAIPRLITREHVGQTIAQFGSLEAKRPGWKYNPKDPREVAQALWLANARRLGGWAGFSTGDVEL